MSYLGIDIGSSQVKAVAFDEKGNALASASCKYSYSMPQTG
jgi:sugar (pentulose or hexulose) kinase